MDKNLGNIRLPKEWQDAMKMNEEYAEANGDTETEVEEHTEERESEQVAQPVKDQPASNTRRVFLGGREFDSIEDLAKYTSELEGQKNRYELEKNYNKPSPAMEQANKPKIADVFYTDPDAFYQITKEDAKNEILEQINREKSKDKLWSNFWDKNKDLKDPDAQAFVEFQFERKKNDLGHLPAEQMLDTIGKEARSMLNRVRGKPEGGRDLPSGVATVASSSNNTPASKAPVKEEPLTFAAQIKRMQSRGK